MKINDVEFKAKDESRKKIDEYINRIFEWGFIVRYAKYDSDKIQWMTPLTFKATAFVKH